jgi:hypothetical protein
LKKHHLPNLEIIERHCVRKIIFAILISLTSICHATSITSSFSASKSGAIPDRTNETEFTCTDTVYILMDAADLKPGQHDVELQWIDPVGDRQELTQFQVHNSAPNTLIWAWMRLHAPENSGLVRAFDQSHGMRDFIGKWRVKISIDGDSMGNAMFDVLC